MQAEYSQLELKNTRRQIDALNKEISELEAEKEQTEDKIELWLSDWKIEERQRELGWVYEQDK